MRPLSGPDKVQRNIFLESCDFFLRRKRDFSTNYGVNFFLTSGAFFLEAVRDFFFLKFFYDCKEAFFFLKLFFPEVGQASAQLFFAGAGVRQLRGDRDSKRVSETFFFFTFVGKRRVLTTPGVARQLWGCASSEQLFFWGQTFLEEVQRRGDHVPRLRNAHNVAELKR